MAEKITKDMESFINAIIVSMKTDRATGIEDYLLCGMADGYNYNGRLTPKIFFDNFHVKPAKLNRIRANLDVTANYRKAIKELLASLSSEQENFIILSGPAGSGKSTFISGFPHIANKYATKSTEKVKTIRMDCAASACGSSYNDVSMKFPMGQLIQIYENYYIELQKERNKKWKETYDWLLRELNRAVSLYKGNNRGYAGKFITFLHSQGITNANKSLTWVNNTKTQTVSLIDRQYAISLLTLLLASKIASTENREKFIVFFDNLEMYIYHTDQPIFGYISIARDIHSLFTELPCILGTTVDSVFTAKGYMTHFTFALCLRTSTRSEGVECLTDGVPNQWEREEARIINLPTYDFSPQAIQNKLQFLQKHKSLTPYYNDVYNYIQPLYDINPDEPIDDDVAIFSSNHYFPFNNCNYRIVIITLEQVAKYSKELKSLDDILKDAKQMRFSEEIRNYIKNGRRMIATRSRYEFLHDQKYLDQLGIANFGEEHRQSNVRAVLNYIFFKTTCTTTSQERKNTVSFWELKNDVRLIESKSFQDIADVVIALGPISCNKIREEALRKWGALINITGISPCTNISDELKTALSEDELARNIHVALTPAGKDYVLNESKQFEYFLFRITDMKGNRQYKPLFSYLQLESAEEAVDAISKVYNAVKSYAEDFSMDCPNIQNCELTDCKECFDKNPTLCMTVIRAFDFFSIIRQHINYIDRYRCVYISNLRYTASHGKSQFASNFLLNTIHEINIKLVNLISDFIQLYDRMETRLKAFEMNNGSLYNHILDISPEIADKIESSDIFPYYHLPSGNSFSSYPFKWGSVDLTEVFDTAKGNDIMPFGEPIKRVYQIMDDIYERKMHDLYG